jgi:hypothetical protein
MRWRSCAAAIALVVGLALAAAAAGIAAGPTATRIVYVAPVDARGHPVASDLILVATKGTCEAGSDSVPGPVYRCFNDDNTVLDPCWAARGLVLDPHHRAVLCMPFPWSRYVVRLDSSGLPPSTQPVPRSLSFPWGVRLANGDNCIALQGAHDQYRGRVVDYACGSGYRLVLLRGMHHSHEPWTFDSAIWDGKSYSPGPTETVSLAWYGGPAPA